VTWICPDCGRRFGRRGQSHECAPALTLEEYFATADPRERPIFEAVAGHLRSLGEVHVEAVAVGIFLKRNGGFVELRPLTRWVALSFPLDRRLDDPRIARVPVRSGSRWYHVVNLRDAVDVDDQVRDWLSQAWDVVPP
jgi:hypothetical protein